VQRLYIIVDRTLSAGLKMAQACHALRAFVGEHPMIDQTWHSESNNLVVLQVEDVPTLAERLESMGIKIARFTEPDLDGALTAIAAEPAAARHLSTLALAS